MEGIGGFGAPPGYEGLDGRFHGLHGCRQIQNAAGLLNAEGIPCVFEGSKTPVRL